MRTAKSTPLVLMMCTCSALVAGQVPAGQAEANSTAPNNRPDHSASSESVDTEHVTLGPNDQVSIWALGVGEIPDKPIHLDDQGYIDVPMLGRIHAAGLTVSELKRELVTRLRNYVQSPQVTVSVIETQSRPVSVIGAVNHPGVYQLTNQRTLLEVLSVAGGLGPEAGQVIRITRMSQTACPPLADAAHGSHQASSTEVSVRRLFDSKDTPDINIQLCAHDIVSVPRADVVYVVGEVQKPGAFPINGKTPYTVLQALTMAGGLTQTAAPGYSKILRDTDSPNRDEVPVNLKRLLGSKDQDVTLQAGDILFVPNSMAKSAGRKAVDAAIQLAIGVTVFRR